MSKFYLKNIRRTMFVIIDEKLFLSPPNLRISHGDWFRKEGWMGHNDKSFLEKNPRGYIDTEGLYIYQGYNARVPAISKKILKKIIRDLQVKLNINNKLHVFLGTIDIPKNKKGKLPPKNDFGSISDILKIKNSLK
jgi:hypothetical protein